MELEAITRQEQIIAGKDLQPVTRMEFFLKAYGGGGSGGGAQPDWNQNDSTAADYVKNRPFYTGDPVETVLVKESTVSFAESPSGLYSGTVLSTFSPTLGETYKVSWDGTTYESACVEDAGDIFIGNPSIFEIGSDTGEPFLVMPKGSIIVVYTADTSASHTLSISQCVAGEVVKIDEKFIPDVSSLIVKSSTAGSTKKFRITVNDSGTISATEVT